MSRGTLNCTLVRRDDGPEGLAAVLAPGAACMRKSSPRVRRLLGHAAGAARLLQGDGSELGQSLGCRVPVMRPTATWSPARMMTTPRSIWTRPYPRLFVLNEATCLPLCRTM